MTLKDSGKLINNALNLLSRIVESDTDVSTIDINLLENLNTNQSLNYIKLEQKLNTLEKDANILEELSNEFKRYVNVIDDIEKNIIKVEAITKEMDRWSLELQEVQEHLYKKDAGGSAN